jgi:putative NADPH-quinone reductase
MKRNNGPLWHDGATPTTTQTRRTPGAQLYDGFSAAQESVKAADQLCFITPVYRAEMAESLKCFFDCLRRCERDIAPRTGQKAALSGKQILLDYIGINRWNNDYKKLAVYSAAKAMAEGRKAGESLKLLGD